MTENVSAATAVKMPASQVRGGKGLTIGIAVSAVVAVVGIVLWTMQLSGLSTIHLASHAMMSDLPEPCVFQIMPPS